MCAKLTYGNVEFDKFSWRNPLKVEGKGGLGEERGRIREGRTRRDRLGRI